MDTLFKKVLKGTYQKLPAIYSPDLNLMVKTLLNVDYNSRPSIA